MRVNQRGLEWDGHSETEGTCTNVVGDESERISENESYGSSSNNVD